MKVLCAKLSTVALLFGFSAPLLAQDDPQEVPDMGEEGDVEDEIASYQDGLTLEAQAADQNKTVADQDQDLVKKHRNYAKKVCEAVKATPEQKAAFRKEVFAYKEKAIPIQANLKLDRLHYVQNVWDPQGTSDNADKIVADAVKNVDAWVAAKGALKTKLLFTILTPEQRPQGLKCLVAIKHLKHARYHGRHRARH